MLFKKFVLVFVFLCLPSFVHAEKFKTVLHKFHRHGEVYNHDNIHASLIFDALYFSEELKEAYVKEIAKMYAWDEERALSFRQELNLKPNQFYVFIFTYQKEWNDLEKKDSSLEINLIQDNNVLEATQIEKIKKIPPRDRKLLTFLNRWGTLYKVTFPSFQTSSPFQLRMTGVAGESTLQF